MPQPVPRRLPKTISTSMIALAIYLGGNIPSGIWAAPEAHAATAYCPGIHYDSRYYRKKSAKPAWVRKHPLNRVMFIGNSITRHAPAEYLGWNNYWGMAASAPDKDWVHWVQLYISIDQAKPADIKVFNTDLPWVDRDFETLRTELERFHPEAAIIQIGDNAQDGSEQGFKNPYAKLLDLVSAHTSRIYILNTWRLSNLNSTIRTYIEDLAKQYGAPFIDIAPLYHDRRNQAVSEPLCQNNPAVDPNVCWHPGDAGMQAIAARVCRKER